MLIRPEGSNNYFTVYDKAPEDEQVGKKVHIKSPLHFEDIMHQSLKFTGNYRYIN